MDNTYTKPNMQAKLGNNYIRQCQYNIVEFIDIGFFNDLLLIQTGAKPLQTEVSAQTRGNGLDTEYPALQK